MLEGVYRILAQSDPTPPSILEALVARLRRQIERRPEWGRFALVVLAELDDPEVKQLCQDLFLRGVSLIRRAIEEGQRRGTLRSDQDPELLAWLVVGLYHLFTLLDRLDLLDRLPLHEFQRLTLPFLESLPS